MNNPNIENKHIRLMCVCVSQRFEQLLRTELSQSEDDKHERLKELQRWNTHWRQQIHPLKNTL